MHYDNHHITFDNSQSSYNFNICSNNQNIIHHNDAKFSNIANISHNNVGNVVNTNKNASFEINTDISDHTNNAMISNDIVDVDY